MGSVTKLQWDFPPREDGRPSEVYATRLREIRKSLDLSQAELARRMTAEGRPLSKVALLRIEKGTRGLSLDEALALAELLQVAPADLLSPPDDSMIRLTGSRAVDGAALRNWLLFGHPLLATPEGQRVQSRIEFTHAVETLAQAILDAKDDSEGKKRAMQALMRVVAAHHDELGQLDEPSAPLPDEPGRYCKSCGVFVDVPSQHNCFHDEQA